MKDEIKMVRDVELITLEDVRQIEKYLRVPNELVLEVNTAIDSAVRSFSRVVRVPIPYQFRKAIAEKLKENGFTVEFSDRKEEISIYWENDFSHIKVQGSN